MADFWKNKTVLITGHEGFLGSNMARVLSGSGARIIGVDKVKNRPDNMLEGLRKNIISIKEDISDLRSVKKIVNKYKPQVIFHIAAEAIVGEANKDPVAAFKSNIEGTWNILEASRDKKFIEAIVVASSDKAYGSHKILPYKEDAALKGSHPYDVSKSCADLICRAYWNTYRVPVCVTRCGNIYGPGDFHLSRIAPDAIRRAVKGGTLLIRSDGKFIRDYVYVEDIVNGYMALAENMKKLRLYGEAFNFSCENPITVIEMVKRIYKLAGKKPDYKILNKAKYEIKNQFLCSMKARRVLNWKPEYTLNQGLKKTIAWYEEKL
ncbi:MAG: SDR family NAD(P)-dependent oxidoreductase [Candidatus Omnitrophota bacterium]|nr:SDR family NAD(P)-dependent oxidoreductase [Candidatus Omnitrophota bacterium]